MCKSNGMLAVLFPNISHMYMSQQLLIEAELVLLWSDIQVQEHNCSSTYNHFSHRRCSCPGLFFLLRDFSGCLKMEFSWNAKEYIVMIVTM